MKNPFKTILVIWIIVLLINAGLLIWQYETSGQLSTIALICLGFGLGRLLAAIEQL